jgi:hypothetical protein
MQGGRWNADEVSWLRQCADWLTHLDADSYPPAVNLRPAADWPDRAIVTVDLAHVQAVIDRIAADVDELTRPGGSRTWTPPRCSPTGARSAAGGWQSRTWSSGPSAPAGDCPPPQPRNWSGPGAHGRPSDTSAARPASGRATPATRSGHADHPPRARVQETGRRSGAHGSIVTGTLSREQQFNFLSSARAKGQF